MATRSRQPIDLIWVMLDLAQAGREEVQILADAQTKARLPNVELSINVNLLHTQALAKVASTPTALHDALTAIGRAAIVRIYTEADHDEAYALVAAAGWTGRPLAVDIGYAERDAYGTPLLRRGRGPLVVTGLSEIDLFGAPKITGVL